MDYFAQLKEITLAQRITDLRRYFGSLRAMGRVLQVDPGHLCRIAQGKKNPSNKLLKKLGLEKRVTYRVRGLT